MHDRTLFVSTGCHQCVPIKEMLKRFEIDHEIHNIDNSGNPLGLRSVPVFVVKGQQFTGIDQIVPAVRALFKGEL